jgi:hypothetical protein
MMLALRMRTIVRRELSWIEACGFGSEGLGVGVSSTLSSASKYQADWISFTYFLTIMGLSFSFFFPSITAALGFNTTDTLLLTAPPWIWAVIVSLPSAWHADPTGERFFHYLWSAVACMVGYIISMATTKEGPRYFAMFLMTTGYASGFSS